MAAGAELLQQVVLLNDQLVHAREDREEAVAAAVRAVEREVQAARADVLALTQAGELMEVEVEKNRAGALKAQEYLKALEVARVEVKRLRLERDLLSDRVRTLEEEARGEVVNNASIVAKWLMPECLIRRPPDDSTLD